MVGYEDARRELLNVHEWLGGINASAAKSLSEGGERLLTVHRLGIPALLRKSLITTNIIESTFNGLDAIEKNWRRLDGYAEIPELVEKIRERNMKLLDNETLIA